MEFKLLHIYTLLSVALVGSHALNPEVYWKSVLPNSPMPKAINDLLSYTKAWDDGKKKVSIDTSMYIKLQDQPVQSYPYVASKYELNHQPLQDYYLWNHGSKDELKDNPIIKLLFSENELHQGEEMKLHFMKNDQKTALLPKNISDSIPFSSKDIKKIYYRFSVKPESMEAEIIKQTLSLCERKTFEGDETFCATSLESMIDFTTRKLGKTVKALSTEVNNNNKVSTPSQKYNVRLVKKLAANKAVVCHTQNYAYAVFFCHVSNDIQSYAVSLEGEDGTKVKSVAVCHTDTSKWNPKHLAFELLKVTPGIDPVCHFLPEDHVLWVPYY